MKKILIVLLMSLFFISPVYADNEIVDVSYQGEVKTQSGVAPVLPSKAKVTFSDGSQKDYNIAWNGYDASLYKTKNMNQFSVSGSIVELDYTTSCVVIVEAASVVGIKELPNKTIIVGTALSLPATTTVTWSNGDRTDEVIQWDPYDDNVLNHIHTFTLTGKVVNQTITQVIHVKQASIISISVPAEVTTQTGIQPDLPQYATVTYSNKKTKQVLINWDNKTFDNAGRYTVYGHLSRSSRTVSIRVNVKEVSDQTQKPDDTKQKTTEKKKTKQEKTIKKKENSSVFYIKALVIIMALIVSVFALVSFVKKKLRIKENR